jgi:preprotein translocase subunit SecF/SecD/SecF fusion protein
MSSTSIRAWPLIRLLPAKTSFRFVGFARIAGILSILAVIGSLTLCLTEGLKLGIDFKGGSSMELSAAPAAVNLGVVRATLNNLHVGDVQVQAIGTSGDALVRFQTPKGADASDTASHVKVALAAAIPNLKFTQSQVVGPKVSGELFRNGVLALAIAIGLMLIYIWFRFELQFGLGAVAALFHDVILTFGLFALFRLEFTLTIIAAILTIIGYSMNDTVVVFDRLRENLRKFRRTPLREVIELSINETLSRTVITGLTAVLALGGLAIFGGEALRNFSIALIFGIVIGTYSSIYVASPIILLWGVKRGEDEAKAGGAAKGGKTAPASRP